MTTETAAFDASGIVLIVEDLRATRELLAQVVAQAWPGLRVETAATFAQARQVLTGLRLRDEGADLRLALVDLGLPDRPGQELFGEIETLAPQALRVVITVYDDDDHVFAAFAAGAQGYLLKEETPEVLGRRLRSLADGDLAISPSLSRRLLEHFAQHARANLPQAEPVNLTPRETEALTLLGQGLRVSEIAQAMGLTPHTVSSHIKRIYSKLGVTTRAAAAVEAMRRRLV